MKEVCIDWNHGHGHFIFRGQHRGCLRMDNLEDYECERRCHFIHY